MKPHRLTAADMEVVPWPRPQPTPAGETTSWKLTLDRAADTSDAKLLEERVQMNDPDLAVRAIVGTGNDVVAEFRWIRYDGDALARSVKAVRLAVEVLPVVSVQGLAISKWSVLNRDD